MALLEYKCPACGGSTEFDTNLQKVKCPYCDTEFEMETLKEFDSEINMNQEEDLQWEEEFSEDWKDEEKENIRIYTCKSCGGEIIGDENTAATKCPFCDNSVIVMGKFSGMLRPNFVIPFKIDKETAKEALQNHFKGKKLLPKVFADENHLDEIKGIYVPFWLYDADVKANTKYRGTKIQMWSDRNFNYTRTSFYLIVRDGEIGFEKIPVDGSSKIDNTLMESLEPFDFSQAVDFQTAYLAGYFADKYDITAENSIDRANERVRNSTEQSFRNSVKGYVSVKPESINLNIGNGVAIYALYPVWLLNTSWKGELYTFAMNGQTGKFVGNLPMDKGVYWKYFGITLAIFSILTFIIGFFII